MSSTTTAYDPADQPGGEVTCRQNASGWWVYYPAERAGKPVRLRKRFKNNVSALQFTEQKKQEIAQHGVRLGTLPAEVRDAYRAYQALVVELAKKGIEAPTFDMLVRQTLNSLAAELMPGESSVAEGVERFLAARKTQLTSRGYQSIRTRLGHFARSLGNRSMQSITAETIDEWLSGLTRQRALDKHSKTYQKNDLSAHSLNHYRAALATFFAHAAAQRWVTTNPVKSVRRIAPHPNHEVFSPHQVTTLLFAALKVRPSAYPVLALQMFAGLRLEEAANINLDDIFANQSTTLQLASSKSGPRNIPICDSLRAWLAISPGHGGIAWSGSRLKLRRDLVDVFSMAGFGINLESPRITYLRNRLEIIGDFAQLASESGCRFALFDALARIAVDPVTAEKFFQLHPPIDR